MIDFRYLELGLAAMSRAHHVSPMAGHLGATLISAYMLGENNPELPKPVFAGIEAELKRVVAGESVFNPKPGAKPSVSELFAPVPKQAGREDLIPGIAEALRENITQPRASGHNVIFGAMAIRALTDHPDLATPFVVDGIRKLVAAFDEKGPGTGYYGKAKGRIDGRKIDLPKEAPPYKDIEGMAGVVLKELVAKAHRRLDGYGGLWHLINHAAALADLQQGGYEELVNIGLPAHHKHLQLLCSLPNLKEELGQESPTKKHPTQSEFWEQPKQIRRERAHLTHRIKTMYGYDALADWVDDQGLLTKSSDRLRHLM